MGRLCRSDHQRHEGGSMNPARIVTADVIDRPAAALPAIPTWVPRAIADFGQKVLANTDRDPDSVQILTRLLVDARMEVVWKALTRKRRDGRFYHPASLDHIEASARQDFAIEGLFRWTCLPFMLGLGNLRLSAVLRRDIDRLRKEDEELARKLRNKAAIEAIWGTDKGRRAKMFEAAAEALDEGYFADIVVDRDRGSGNREA